MSQRGSHIKFVRYNGDEVRTAIVPHHANAIAGWSVTEVFYRQPRRWTNAE